LGGGGLGLGLGAGIGAVSGGLGGYVGNLVATPVSGVVNRVLVDEGVSAVTSWTIGRYSGMVSGGYAGGVTASLFGNSAATLAVDAVTGRPVTAGQFWDATTHAFEVDGPLNV